MRVASPHHEVLAYAVISSGLKSIHEARGDLERAKHHDHGGSKVLAISLPGFEQKTSDGVARIDRRRVERVAEVVPQVVLDGHGAVVIVRRRSANLRSQVADARGEFREAQVNDADFGRIIGPG